MGNAITVNSTVAANQLINANLSQSVTRTVATPSTYYAVTNNSANTLTLAGGINANSAGVKVLNVTGSGNSAISGAITSGTGNMSLFKTGTGTLTLSGGGTFSGVGVRDGANFDSSAVFREGTTTLNGGTYSNSGGEPVIGGVATHGGAGTNTTLRLDNGAIFNNISWLSVGRGNGNGTATSDLTLNGSSLITSTNLSADFNTGNAANISKGTITLNGTSILEPTTTVNFAEKKYPVLYLLHGFGGNHYEWTGYLHAHTILDNLSADGKAVPMIVVMPNGRALPDDRPPKEIYSPEHAAGFAKFERDLLDCLIPALQAKYLTLTDREHRALAGLSMGGGQTINFGLAHLDTFAWLGGFSTAPNTKPLAELIPDPAAARKSLKLFYLSCGNKDGLINGSQGVHAFLKQNDIPHIWNVDDHGHDGATRGSNLYHFARKLFR